MSYPGVDPSDTIVAEPVGTQAVSEGNPLIAGSIVEDEIVEATKLKAKQADIEKVVQQKVSDMFAVSESWAPKQLVKFVIEFDSGQKCLVKHLTTMDLVNADLVEDIDFFTKKLFATQEVMEADGEEQTANAFSESFWGTLRDVEKRKRFLEMTGKLMQTASIKPKVVFDGVGIIDDENGEKTTVFGYDLKDDAKRQIEIFGRMIPALKEGETYASAIDIGDRLTFFRSLMAPLDTIQPFRDEQASMLGSVQPSESVELPTE